MARKTLYRDEYAELARRLCRLGLIDGELAAALGVSVRTIQYWKKNHPEFKAAIDDGKIIADARVADSLFMRATGYDHEEDKILSHEGVHTDTVRITKHYPPDVAAQIFWLKNRQPKLWRDRVDHAHGGPNGETLKIISEVTFVEGGSKPDHNNSDDAYD